jgi:short-subunit dehydrogenase
VPTALITGATAGIGAAFARRLAADGMDLVLLARDGARLAAAAADYRSTYQVKAEVLIADLATDDGIAAAERRVAEGGSGAIGLLVNNAGFAQQGRFLDAPLADELAMLRVHCEAVLRLTHAALPGMIDRGRGEIVNVASMAAFLSRGTYGASKAWVVGFSQGVNQDIRQRGAAGVHIMALCPGLVHTEFHDRAGMDLSRIPEFMWLNADMVVAAAVRDLRRAREISVPGGQYKTLAGVTRLLPRNLVGRVSARTGRRYR